METKRYTKDELIAILQRKARELGRSPKVTDTRRDKSIPSYATYYYAFGSWNGALEAANLRPAALRYSEAELIDLLQKKAKELGKTPTALEVEVDPDMPTPTTYRNVFGTWNEALKVANLRPIITQHWSKMELIDMLQKKAKELGRAPTASDMNADDEMPSSATYRNAFGSWNEALLAADLSPNKVSYSSTKMLLLLREKAEELGRTPKIVDVDADPAMPSGRTYHAVFGTWNTALELAGLKKRKI